MAVKDDIVMKEAQLLLAGLIEKARRKGFDIMVLVACIGGLVWWVLRLDARIDSREIKWETKLERVNTEWFEALNEANKRIADCERDKYDLSLRVAVLELGSLRTKKR